MVLDLQKGDTQSFLALCQHSGLSYLLEQVLKRFAKLTPTVGRVHVATVPAAATAAVPTVTIPTESKGTELAAAAVTTLASPKPSPDNQTERTKVLQKQLLEAMVKHRHRFYELHLNNWHGLTDDLLINLATHSKGALRVLKLSGCKQLGERAIAKVTELCPNLTILDVSDCTKLTGWTVRKIATHCRQLKRLNLSGLTNLHSICQMDMFNRPAGALVFPALEWLQLNGCVGLITYNVDAPHLKLNHISIEGCVALISLFEKRFGVTWDIVRRLVHNDPSFTELDLFGKELGPKKISALAPVLAQNRTLRVLRLSLNEFGYAGAEAIATVLAQNSTLRELHLDYNDIGSKGIHALTTGRTLNTTLVSLALYGNSDVESEAVVKIS